MSKFEIDILVALDNIYLLFIYKYLQIVVGKC
jgi:hypothetical protein